MDQLLQARADVNLKDLLGKTPLDIARPLVYAQRYKDVAARLMKAAGEQEKEDVRRAQGCQDEQDQETTYNTQDGSSVTRPPQQA